MLRHDSVKLGSSVAAIVPGLLTVEP